MLLAQTFAHVQPAEDKRSHILIIFSDDVVGDAQLIEKLQLLAHVTVMLNHTVGEKLCPAFPSAAYDSIVEKCMRLATIQGKMAPSLAMRSMFGAQ